MTAAPGVSGWPLTRKKKLWLCVCGFTPSVAPTNAAVTNLVSSVKATIRAEAGGDGKVSPAGKSTRTSAAVPLTTAESVVSRSVPSARAEPQSSLNFASADSNASPSCVDAAFAASLAELHRLARTLGLLPTATITQRRTSFHPGTVIGSGKLKELQALTGMAVRDEAQEVAGAPSDGKPIKVVLVDHDISPSQARNLEKATGAEVMDRTAVILEIFRRHARSRVAKAQVEIVRLQYMAPRMRETGAGKDRQRGGIGGKGAGESGLELDRRKLRDRIAELTG